MEKYDTPEGTSQALSEEVEKLLEVGFTPRPIAKELNLPSDFVWKIRNAWYMRKYRHARGGGSFYRGPVPVSEEVREMAAAFNNNNKEGRA